MPSLMSSRSFFLFCSDNNAIEAAPLPVLYQVNFPLVDNSLYLYTYIYIHRHRHTNIQNLPPCLLLILAYRNCFCHLICIHRLFLLGFHAQFNVFSLSFFCFNSKATETVLLQVLYQVNFRTVDNSL